MWIRLLPSFLTAVNAQTQACSTQATVTVSNYDSSASLAASCVDLPGSLEISNSASEDITLDGMETIMGNLTCERSESGDGFTSLASSTLTMIFGELKLSSVAFLSDVEFDQLSEVHGLDITSNVALQTLNFSNLKYSWGPVKLTGNFSSILLPKLKVVNGTFQVASATNFDCSVFDNANEAGVYQGLYSCSGINATSTASSSLTQSFITSATVVETKTSSNPASGPSSIPPTVLPKIQPSSTTTAQAGDSGFTKKDKLAVGLGTGAVVATFGIIIVAWVSWKIRKAYKEHEDIVSRTPVRLTGHMHLDNVPQHPKSPGQTRYGDPRQSGLSYHEVHTELQELRGLEEDRTLTALEEERKTWLMEHLFLRAQIGELEG